MEEFDVVKLDAEMQSQKQSKFSYSKLNTYESCPWKYKLQYIDHHFVDSSTIANEFGTLIHFVEETIAKDIIANDNEPLFMLNDDKYIDIFINAGMENHDVQNVLGARKLKQKYPQAFDEKDKYGYSYDDKANIYLNFGIYRLRDFLCKNRNLRIIGIETPFDVTYGDKIFHGFIDRVFRDIETGDIIIEDIKTWQDIKGHDLVTPLQFVFYSQAAQELFEVGADQITCFYELPLAGDRYKAGTPGFMKRGAKKIDKLLAAIDAKDFEPKPTPLCHWCCFSDTFPDQPEAGKNLCPYRSNWTKSCKDFSVEFEWMGIENHESVLEAYIRKHSIVPHTSEILPLPVIKEYSTDRISIARRR